MAAGLHRSVPKKFSRCRTWYIWIPRYQYITYSSKVGCL